MLKFKNDVSKKSVLFQTINPLEMDHCMKQVLAKDSFTLVSRSSANIQTTFDPPTYLEANHNYELSMANLET